MSAVAMAFARRRCLGNRKVSGHEERELAKPGSARTTELIVSNKPPNPCKMGLCKPGLQAIQGTKYV